MDIGETLTRAREDAGLTVEEVSRRTRIRETVIRAIERNDFSLCGGDFYARGHIRSLARVVGIDAEPLVQAFDEAHGGPQQDLVEVFDARKPLGALERRSPNWSAAMAVALVILLAFVVFRVVSGGGKHPVAQAPPTTRPPAPSSSSPAPVPSPSPRPSATDSPLAYGRDVNVVLHAADSSWVSVRDASGTVMFEGLVPGGETRKWTAGRRIRLIIGNAGGVNLTVNGKDIGPVGDPGSVVRLSFGPGDPTAG